MTDETPESVIAARALAAAYDALSSDEHKAEFKRLAELSQRVSDREEAYMEAQARLHAVHSASCESGRVKPAPNVEAKAVIEDNDPELVDLTSLYPEDEYSTPRANGALNGD